MVGLPVDRAGGYAGCSGANPCVRPERVHCEFLSPVIL